MQLLRDIVTTEGREMKAAVMPATFAGRFLLECATTVASTCVVWRAQELATGARVALKFFPASLVQDPLDLASLQQVIRCTVAPLHPGLIPAHELVTSDRYAALVAPWIEGPTLRQMLYARPGRFFEVDDLRRWLRALLDIVEALHAHGVVHGALNPDVVIHQGGELRVVGCAVDAWLRRALARHQGLRSRDEHRAYWSPAQRRGEPDCAADDVFAVGVMVYELLAGTPPSWGWWRRRPHSIVYQRRRNGGRGGVVPVTWDRAIRRCLESRERARLGSIRELRMRLDLGGPFAGIAPAAMVKPSRARAAGAVPSHVAAAGAAPQEPATASASRVMRPPLQGREAAASAPVGARAVSAMPTLSGPTRATRVLRGMYALVAMGTLATGVWLGWHVYQRYDGFRNLSLDPKPVDPETTEAAPPTAPEPVAVTSAVPPEPAAVSESKRPAPVVPALISARLTVRSDPPGAEVRVGERAMERAPCTITGLDPGRHVVEARLPGHRPFTAEIELAPGADQHVEARLEPLTGTLQVMSEPAGAAFVVRNLDGRVTEQRGRTPAELQLLVGRYVVDVRGEHAARSLVVDVLPERPTTARATFPPPEAAPLPPRPVDESTVKAEPAPAEKADAPNTASEPATPAVARIEPSETGPIEEETAPEPAPQVPLPEPGVIAAQGPPLDAGIFELSDVDVVPRVISRVDPELSTRDLRATETARVELIVVIDRLGRVASASVHRATDAVLGEASLRAVRLWRFSPATRHGQAVPVRVAVPLAFKKS